MIGHRSKKGLRHPTVRLVGYDEAVCLCTACKAALIGRPTSRQRLLDATQFFDLQIYV
jgi:hypothetical protein